MQNNEILPKKLLACSGIHLSLFPQIANTMTPKQPQTPPPSVSNPILCKCTKSQKYQLQFNFDDGMNL